MDMKLPFLKEAPLLMKPGAKFRFEVPGALGFGPQPRGPDLPPNSTTVWVLELVRVLKPLPVPPFEKPDEAKFQKTASGLLWQAVKEGEGEAPKGSDRVKVHYAGWLTDGDLFDSSFGRGEPAEFPVAGVIPGWTEGLKMMKPGAVYRFVIPANLAYGDRQAGDKIKPGSTLVFYVELIAVLK
jgi:FKBP-type peptidyl-prolyl cis-trans isomerase